MANTYGIDLITGLPYLVSVATGDTITNAPTATPSASTYGIDLLTGEEYITNVDGEIPTEQHNLLEGLQGGLEGEYNHLTNTQLQKLDSIELPDFSVYEKLAIDITIVDILNLKNTATLIPSQWYKVTDFTNVQPINGTYTVEYFTGDTEQFYVQALTIDKLSNDVISATYVGDTMVINWDVNTDLQRISGNGYTEPVYVYYENGTNSGNLTLQTPTLYNKATMNLSAQNIADLDYGYNAESMGFYCSGYDGNSRYEFSLNSDNFGDDWMMDNDGKTIILLDGTQQYSSIDLTALNTDGWIEIGFGSNTYINNSELQFIFTSPITAVVSTHLEDFNNRYDFYFEGCDGIYSVYIDNSNLGDDWDYNPTTGTITLLDGTQGFASSGFDFTKIPISGYYNCNISVITKTFNGRVINRSNKKQGIDIGADYRATKYRRYKPVYTNWAAGTYNQGTVVMYNGVFYYAPTQLSTQPNATNSGWCQFHTGNEYFLSKDQIYIKESVIPIDQTQYVDYFMFNSIYSDANNNISIKDQNLQPIDVCFLGNNTITDVELIITNYARFTVINSINFTNLTISNSTCVFSISDSYGKLHGGYYFSLISKFSFIGNSYMYNAQSQDFGYVYNATLCRNCNNNKIEHMQNVIVYGDFSSNDIKYLYNSTFKNNCNFNLMFDVNNLVCNYQFLNNKIYGKINNATFNCNYSNNTNYGEQGNNTFNSTSGGIANNVFMSSVVNNNMTFNGIIGNVFIGTVNNNTITSSNAYLGANKFMGEFSTNNLTGAINIQDNQFNGSFINNTGGNGVVMSYNIFNGTYYNNVHNVGSSAINIKSNFVGGNWVQNTYNNAYINNNIFNGVVSTNTFNGTFKVMDIGDSFNGNTLSGTIEYGSRYAAYQSKTETGNSNNYVIAPLYSKIGIGTATPTQLLSVAEKTSINDNGGIMIKLTNRTGSNTVKGTIVSANLSNEEAFYTTPANGDMPIGIVYETGVANGSEAWIVISGIAEVLFKDTVAPTRGYVAYVSDTDGRAENSSSVPAATTHFREIGHPIQTKTAGTSVLAKVVIHFN
jgi:hypothetical protein